ncbi:MAG: FkbM family methyltransferase, partial [Chloroflexota bacterium]
KTIYDFGANKGDNIPYYLLKADLVVAVEANPGLCQRIQQKFAAHIEKGQLVVENCVITSDTDGVDVDFYIHKRKPLRSQFPKPDSTQIDEYERRLLPGKRVKQLISEYGEPFYIKIDVEHYDSEVLRALWQANILPPYISAEAHSIEIFSLLVTMGYSTFKLVDSSTVANVYSNRVITGIEEAALYSFPHHAAGPFGNDIDGRWMTADNFFRHLALEGLGWKDIHASRIEAADPDASVRTRDYLKRLFVKKLKSRMRKMVR